MKDNNFHAEMYRDVHFVKNILERYENRKLLEIFFLRSNGENTQNTHPYPEELYLIDVKLIKKFLLAQNPKDEILQKVLDFNFFQTT
jgi:hypothetical protein